MQTLRQKMRTLTLEALEAGMSLSDMIRDYIASTLSLPVTSSFTNTHAWALVDLQSSHEITKIGPRRYALNRGQAGPYSQRIPAPTKPLLPAWAREQIVRANRKSGASGPRFTEDDLIALWNSCGGVCAVTRLDFSLDPVGDSLVRRVYKPSLDRIKAGQPYTRENCRLVLTAVNFAMNAWGEDVYLRIARAAVQAQPA